MYTIKEASARTGVPIASLRAWERRYAVVQPRRTQSGYRLYDDQAIAVLSAMRLLVEDGWSPAIAAATIAEQGPESVLGRATRAVAAPRAQDASRELSPAGQRLREARMRGDGRISHPEGRILTESLLEAAAAFDADAIESALDQGFALGTFEAVVDEWLMPSLRALGDAWAAGAVDVSGEHTASHAVMRRLGQHFAAASSLSAGPRVLVGLPAGAQHELGALAFATAVRRRGLCAVYVGSDLPVASWRRAVQAFPTDIAVLAVPTTSDRPSAEETVRELRRAEPGLVVALGGRYADEVDGDVVRLPRSITEAARAVADLRA